MLDLLSCAWGFPLTVVKSIQGRRRDTCKFARCRRYAFVCVPNRTLRANSNIATLISGISCEEEDRIFPNNRGRATYAAKDLSLSPVLRSR